MPCTVRLLGDPMMAATICCVAAIELVDLPICRMRNAVPDILASAEALMCMGNTTSVGNILESCGTSKELLKLSPVSPCVRV